MAASPSTGPGFPSTSPSLPDVTIGEAHGARRLRLVVHDLGAGPGGTRRRPHGRSCRGCARRNGAARSGHAARDRAASGRQPGVRSGRQSLRHLQRNAGAGSACLDLSREPDRTPRVVCLGDRQSDVDDVRRGRAAVRVEPVRRDRSIACFPTARTSRMPATSASPAVSRSIAKACSMSAIDRARCSRCSLTEPSRRSPRCRRVSRPFISRSGRTTACYVSAPTLGPYDHVYRLDPATGAIDKMYSGFGRPQGIAFDSQGALYVVEALAGSNGLYRVTARRQRRADRGGAVARGSRVQSRTAGWSWRRTTPRTGSMCRYDRSPCSLYRSRRPTRSSF